MKEAPFNNLPLEEEIQKLKDKLEKVEEQAALERKEYLTSKELIRELEKSLEHAKN